VLHYQNRHPEHADQLNEEEAEPQGGEKIRLLQRNMNRGLHDSGRDERERQDVQRTALRPADDDDQDYRAVNRQILEAISTFPSRTLITARVARVEWTADSPFKSVVGCSSNST
jgi:hypothetical protein